MARNDSINRTMTRNGKYTRLQIGNIERHNERKNESYQNTDIQRERSDMNIYFKQPTEGYIATFDKMREDGTISTKGLKENAIHYNEFLFDVNTSYFEERGGYEFAKEFFSKAYDYAVKEVGGEQYILSAVMHADERNAAISEQLGKDVYHYHLHVVYVPVVQKEVKWSKRCKDKSLVGTVKEVITQVSHSKKWASHKEIGEDGKPYLVKSYSLLQDRFFEYMRDCGYSDIERCEKGSTEQNLSTTQYKVAQEKQRLQATISKVDSLEKSLAKISDKQAKIKAVNEVEIKQATFQKGKLLVDEQDFADMKILAQKHIVSESKTKKLTAENKQLKQENQLLSKELFQFKSVTKQLHAGKEKIRLAELEKFQDLVMKFLDKFGLKEKFEQFRKSLNKQRNEVNR